MIVGAAGSLGRQLAPLLAEHGHEVVCFDLELVNDSPYRCEPPAMAAAAEGCQALVHIAA